MNRGRMPSFPFASVSRWLTKSPTLLNPGVSLVLIQIPWPGNDPPIDEIAISLGFPRFLKLSVDTPSVVIRKTCHSFCSRMDVIAATSPGSRTPSEYEIARACLHGVPVVSARAVDREAATSDRGARAVCDAGGKSVV